jgi:peptidoglycan/xylan/chitin deacetylase (PgdA/CDA1 family)
LYTLLPSFCLPYVCRLLLLCGLALAPGAHAQDLAATPRISATPAPIRFLLTFDDGPSGSDIANPTARVLDVLARNSLQAGIKAIFFVQTRAYRSGATGIGQALLQREHDEGHLLAFHTATTSHANHRFLDAAGLELALSNGCADLQAYTGKAPKLVRPPFWNYDARTFAAYQAHGLSLLLTDLSANDGKIWGVNFSLNKRRNMLQHLRVLRETWRKNELPVVDGSTPVVVALHDLNRYSASVLEDYLEILLDVARELEMPTASKAFYDDRDELERAALARTIRDADSKSTLPGFWNWLWQSGN